MPDAKDNAKLSGDVHPPELEDRLGQPEPRPEGAQRDSTGGRGGLAQDLEAEGRPGEGENQAGFVKDRDLSGGRSR